VDEITQRLIAAGLDPGQSQQSEPGVPIVNAQGQQEVVPASIGTYHAVSQLAQMIAGLGVRLDAIHHHLASREHPSKRQNCMLCVAQAEQAKAIAEQESREINHKDGHRDAMVVAGGVGAGTGIPGPEEEQEMVQE